MGYSYTAMAGFTLDAISAILRDEVREDEIVPAAPGSKVGSNSILRNGGFWETGREQADGSITGTVWKAYAPDPSRVTKAGAFKITPDGRIAFFPGTTKSERKWAYGWAVRKYAETFERPLTTPAA